MPSAIPWELPLPSLTTRPTPSWPGMKGGLGLTGHSPRAAWMSVWQRPQVSIWTRTCSGPGSGTGTSSMLSGCSKSCTTAAFIAGPPEWGSSRSISPPARLRAIGGSPQRRVGFSRDSGPRPRPGTPPRPRWRDPDPSVDGEGAVGGCDHRIEVELDDLAVRVGEGADPQHQLS